MWSIFRQPVHTWVGEVGGETSLEHVYRIVTRDRGSKHVRKPDKQETWCHPLLSPSPETHPTRFIFHLFNIPLFPVLHLHWFVGEECGVEIDKLCNSCSCNIFLFHRHRRHYNLHRSNAHMMHVGSFCFTFNFTKNLCCCQLLLA